MAAAAAVVAGGFGRTAAADAAGAGEGWAEMAALRSEIFGYIT